MKPKVIFLDIDGVLNSLETAKRDGGYGIAKELHARLQDIRTRTNANIVISSAWRVGDGWKERLEEAGLDTEYVIGKTPRMGRPAGTGWEYNERGREIAAWLEKHPQTGKYAIIDDDSDMLPEQMQNFFQTDNRVGLTQEIAERVVAHLT